LPERKGKVRVKLLVLALCSLFLFSHPVVYAATTITKVKTPFLEMQPVSIELEPMEPKAGPGGEGEITVKYK
jgi:hypothetical protein